MSKTKKSRHNKSDSEESSSSSSSSGSTSSSNSSTESSSSSHKSSSSDGKRKKSKKIKSKYKMKQKSSSFAQCNPSNSDNRYQRGRKSSEVDQKSYDKHSYKTKDDNRKEESNSTNNWTSNEYYNERSKWDSPNRETGHHSGYDRRRSQNNYYNNRNQNFQRHDNRNRGWGGGSGFNRRNDSFHERRDWRNHNNYNNRGRYNRDGQINRNYDRRNSPRRWDDNREESFKNRRSEERKSYNQDDNERRYNERDDRHKRRSRSHSPRRHRKFPRKTNEDNKTYEWGKKENNEKDNENESEYIEKEKPNFGLSGKLTEDTNTVNGIVIKYAEPQEARKPKRRWRLYPFKGEKALQTLYIHRQSCYLIGRDRKICDLPVDHPSCSKQHAALQYRLVPFEREDGTVGKRVRPYIIDLESANGTFINNKQIESKKYIELLEKDVIKFGFSSREYVLLHENSKEEEQDDDVYPEEIDIKEEPAG